MHDAAVARTANLLGAAALAVTDLMLAAAASSGGVGPSAAAALVVLRATPDLSATELGRRIGLSQPAAARMLDSMAAAGLVRRERGQGRTVPVRLTADGARAAEDLVRARAEPLAVLVAGLDEADRAALDGLLATLLARLYDRVGSTELLCRLCDRPACTKGARCPVGAAAEGR
ncbi:MarR family winged helix-turn-helix transcriptional regulator [Pseudonocardia acaciae]|uniref:MarR family winged helix-turn-helix transcriptional regulator n=1 Tax=Pseudonocardia acaciae TaxID=551276 RepID=UPI00049137C7|nr:MarR family transcriptional regulator [Pseudonocardia acaciae]